MKNIGLSTVVFLVMSTFGVAEASSCHVETDLLGRTHVYENGNLVVTAKKDLKGVTYFYDSDREELGHSITDNKGNTTYWNSNGENVGHASKDAEGTTYYDASGKLLGKFEDDKSDVMMFFDVVLKHSGLGFKDTSNNSDTPSALPL